jgi:hypothetical protein
MGVWLWSVDTLDWMAEGPGLSSWAQRIIRLAEQGGALPHPIVLMHDGRRGNPATVTALPAIIAFFRSHGYRFVALLPPGPRPGSSRPRLGRPRPPRHCPSRPGQANRVITEDSSAHRQIRALPPVM